MDFRSAQPQTNHSAAPVNSTSAPVKIEKSSKKDDDNHWMGKWLRAAALALLFGGTVLIVAIIAILYVGNDNQSKFVNDKKYQAVFLTNGQVYFGNVKSMGKDYINLTNIYYLTQNTTTDKSGNTTS